MAFKMFDKVINSQVIIFQKNQQDGSGYISSDELKDMFSGGSQKIEDSVWNELIKEVDQNGDGQVIFF